MCMRRRHYKPLWQQLDEFEARLGERLAEINRKLGAIVAVQDDINAAVTELQAVSSDLLTAVTNIQTQLANGQPADTSALNTAVDQLKQADQAIQALETPATPPAPDAGN